MVICHLLRMAMSVVSDRTSSPDHYNEQALVALVIAIANINVWNRLNVITRQVAVQE
jgi:alkylhydroperoxidase family enzyme